MRPPPRTDGALVWDDRRGRLFLFGGQTRADASAPDNAAAVSRASCSGGGQAVNTASEKMATVENRGLPHKVRTE